MKAPRTSASCHAPRLGLRSAVQPGNGGAQPPARQQEGARERGAHEDIDVEVRLKRALESLSAAETSMAELAREATQARFELEDAQVVLATAKTKVGKTRERESEIERATEICLPLVYHSVQDMR